MLLTQEADLMNASSLPLLAIPPQTKKKYLLHLSGECSILTHAWWWVYFVLLFFATGCVMGSTCVCVVHHRQPLILWDARVDNTYSAAHHSISNSRSSFAKPFIFPSLLSKFPLKSSPLISLILASTPSDPPPYSSICSFSTPLPCFMLGVSQPFVSLHLHHWPRIRK